MSEVETDSTQQQSHDRMASAGSILREARESRHMSLQMLASALKVPTAKLQALEEDRWDVLTDAVFVRALALSVCRVLQIDSASVLALLPKAGAAKLSTNPEGINAPFKDKTLRSSMSFNADSHSGHTAKLLAVLLMVVLGAAAMYFLPQWQPESDVGSTVADIDINAAPVLVPEPLVVATPVATPATDDVVSAPVLDASSGVQAAPSSASVNVSTAVKPDERVSSAAPVNEGKPVLRFTATGETWVQVRNAQQQVVMERILKAGDVYEATAASRPLQVVVGNADVTKLEIDGAAWDLAVSARNNVARFEVK